MKLSIVILNYKSKNMVKQCLENIANLILDFSHEIIVVDNCSDDGIEEMLAQNFKQIKFVQTGKNFGMGVGNNYGISEAQGEYILILNPDVVVFKNTIERLIEFLQQNERVGIIAPRVLNPDGTVVDSCCRWPKPSTFLYRRTFLGATKKGVKHLDYYLYKDKDLHKSQAVDWVFGCSFLIRKRALDEVGVFDARFFLFLEETDLMRRMWNKDWKVWYLPIAEVVHYPHRRTIGTGQIKDLWSKYTWIHLHSWVKYFRKWRDVENIEKLSLNEL